MIRASFIHAKHKGFNDQAIVAACRDLELPSVTGSILKNGPYDVVIFAMDEWRKQMKEDILVYEDDDIKFQDLKTPQKIKLGVKTRLELMAPYIDKWP